MRHAAAGDFRVTTTLGDIRVRLRYESDFRLRPEGRLLHQMVTNVIASDEDFKRARRT